MAIKMMELQQNKHDTDDKKRYRVMGGFFAAVYSNAVHLMNLGSDSLTVQVEAAK
jgi:hypothetical protein